MRLPLPLSLLPLLFLTLPADALRFPFRTRVLHPNVHALIPRADTNTTVGVSIRNSQNIQYIGNISLGGTDFNVVLDTGSSDLWIAGSVPSAQDTGKAVTLAYAIGKATGNVHTAKLGLDNYTVDNQAFVLVNDTASFSTNITSQGYQGLIGLGPNTGSVVRDKIGSSSADSPLFRIFEASKPSQNYITILLDRKGDPDDDFAGQLTIGELVPGFTNVTSQPKLTIKDVPTLTDADQHWAVFTDVHGVIGPDGEAIAIKSIVPRAPSGKLVAVIDSGFSLPQVPRAMSDAIYGRVQGAKYDEDEELWTLPCDQELNITFKFGGVSIPVHPLDTASSDFNLTDSSGSPLCVGMFQPITSAFSLLGEYDMILGMAFLRNAYTLIDFGNFVSNTDDDSDPFVQLLPLTVPAEAHADFVKIRLNNVDTTGSASKTLLPASQESHSPESAAEKKQHREGQVLKYWPYILVGCLVLVILMVGGCVWGCCRRRRRNRAKGAALAAIPGVQKNPYQPIHEPAPPMHMQPMGGYTDPYGHGRTSPRI